MSHADVGLTDHIDALQQRLEDLREGTSAQDPDLVLAELESAYEELRVADEEVRTQREELQTLLRAQSSVRDAHERFVALLPAAVVVTDRHGVVATANAAAAALLGVPHGRLAGKPLLAFVETSARPELRRFLAAAVARPGGETRTLTTLQPRAGGPRTVEVALTVRGADPGASEVAWVLLGPGAGRLRPGSPLGTGLARALVELSELPLSGLDTSALLTGIARVSQAALPAALAVSVTMGDPTAPELVATDSQVAQQVDGAQVVAGEGPCVLAWRTGATVVTTGLAEDPRWPRLGPRVAASEVGAAVAVPVWIGDTAVGALNVYGADASLTGPEELEAAELLAAAVSAVLHEVQVKEELRALSDQLRTALVSRATIEQAKGIVMAREGCEPEEAFRLLVKVSSETNVKLREVARRLVEDAATRR